MVTCTILLTNIVPIYYICLLILGEIDRCHPFAPNDSVSLVASILIFKYLSRCSWHEKSTGRLSIWHEPFSFDIIWTIRNLGLAAGHVGITKYSPSSQEVHHFGPTQKLPETYKNQHGWPESQVKRQGIVYLIVLCECCPNCGLLWTIKWLAAFCSTFCRFFHLFRLCLKQ